MANEDLREQLLSRKNTRVTVESTLNRPYTNRSRISHIGLALPSRTCSRLSRFKPKPFDPEDDYILDSTDEEDESPIPNLSQYTPTPTRRGIQVYQDLCRKYGKVPIRNVSKQFGQRFISLNGYNLSQKELKAFFVALLEFYENSEDEQLNPEESDELCYLALDGNTIGRRQLFYVIDFADAHRSLVQLSLVDCRICCRSLRYLAHFMRRNKTLQKLDLSDNNLTDNAGASICEIIEHGAYVKELVLRGNKLAECGTGIGKALKANNTLVVLDLCWNHIRGNGAIGLCKGLQVNRRLETLLLAWNGFGFEGSTAMGYALAENTTLQALDLSNNRIHPPAMFELIKGLEKNKALSVLKIGYNPITASMTSVLLTKLYLAKESNLTELDLAGVIVDKDFDGILKEIQDKRTFIVRYDLSLPVGKNTRSKIDSNNIFNIDPVRILFYMKEHLRTIDLFMKVDKDGSKRLDKEEMRFAFEREGLPISERDLNSVMNYLDTNKDGGVDLMEFINGERRLKRHLIKEDEDEIMTAKQHDQKYSQAFTAEKSPRKLPPLTGAKMS